ncbi:hypothetical protein GCM10022409_17870 [Hymenobacter glaciei]|uniref:Carboxypeptidase-like regulatory domain-containing protein n=1 Tax=Hymenobacter glaciei TaxID=877209 RepID=A0ABP7U088_9BACT
MLPEIASVFLLFLPLHGRAQEVLISGQVVDAATKKPVEYASMSLRNAQTGALTDLQGRFQIAGLSPNTPDSLIMMTLAYERYAMVVTAAKCTDLVLEVTQRKGFSLGRVYESHCRPYPVIPESEQLRFSIDSQYAFFIPNKEHKQLGKLRAVSLFLGDEGLPSTPFRLRIYRPKGKNQSPGADLLSETVFIKAAEDGKWHTIDLSAYNIPAVKEGFFIAVEFAVPRTVIPPAELASHPPKGLIMRPDFEVKKSNTWHFSPATGWSLAPLTGGMRRYNAMVKAEVEVLN